MQLLNLHFFGGVKFCIMSLWFGNCCIVFLIRHRRNAGVLLEEHFMFVVFVLSTIKKSLNHHFV